MPSSLRGGMPFIVREEGIGGLYKGLAPLWGRQVPYTVAKFWAFERVVEFMYQRILSKPRETFSKPQQACVSLASGYVAGVFCAIVSHPGDTVVSRMNQYATRPGLGQVLRDIGFFGIWRGLGVRTFMVGSLAGMQWLIYDAFKVYTGLPATGAVKIPAKYAGTEK